MFHELKFHHVHPQVNRLYQVIHKMRGLDYATQHELCKELDEKDEEFIDALKVRAILLLREQERISHTYYKVINLWEEAPVYTHTPQ